MEKIKIRLICYKLLKFIRKSEQNIFLSEDLFLLTRAESQWPNGRRFQKKMPKYFSSFQCPHIFFSELCTKRTVEPLSSLTAAPFVFACCTLPGSIEIGSLYSTKASCTKHWWPYYPDRFIWDYGAAEHTSCLLWGYLFCTSNSHTRSSVGSSYSTKISLIKHWWPRYLDRHTLRVCRSRACFSSALGIFFCISNLHKTASFLMPLGT